MCLFSHLLISVRSQYAYCVLWAMLMICAMSVPWELLQDGFCVPRTYPPFYLAPHWFQDLSTALANLVLFLQWPLEPVISPVVLLTL